METKQNLALCDTLTGLEMDISSALTSGSIVYVYSSFTRVRNYLKIVFPEVIILFDLTQIIRENVDTSQLYFIDCEDEDLPMIEFERTETDISYLKETEVKFGMISDNFVTNVFANHFNHIRDSINRIVFRKRFWITYYGISIKDVRQIEICEEYDNG